MTALRSFGETLLLWFRAVTRPARIPHERRTALWPVKGRILIAAAISVAALAGAMLFIDTSVIGEARLAPAWVRDGFEWITWFGIAGWFLWPTGIALVIIAASPWRKLTHFSQGLLAAIAVRLSFVFLAIGAPVLFTAIVKRLIGRARPLVSEIVNPYSYDPLVWKESYASFPSGHSTNVFAAAIAIGAIWPKARLPMWIYAVLIAASRVMVDAHFPSDVIAGAIVGSVGAIMVRGWFAARGLGFAVGKDGIIHHFPGPSWKRSKDVARRLWALIYNRA